MSHSQSEILRPPAPAPEKQKKGWPGRGPEDITEMGHPDYEPLPDTLETLSDEIDPDAETDEFDADDF